MAEPREAKSAVYFCYETKGREWPKDCIQVTYEKIKRARNILIQKGYITKTPVYGQNREYFFKGGLAIDNFNIVCLNLCHPTNCGLEKMAKSLKLPAPKL